MSILRVLGAWSKPNRATDLDLAEAQRHFDSQNWEQAETHFTAALQNSSAQNAPMLLLQLSRVQLAQNKLAEALATARAGVESSKKDPLLLWTALDHLASVQLSQGDVGAALETLDSMDRAETAQKKPDSHRLLQSSRKRANLLLASGRVPVAKVALEESLRLTELIYGPDHTATASLLTEMGALDRQAGRHHQAQHHLQRALSIHRGAEEFNFSLAAESLRNLALSLEESGDLQGAASEYERFVSVCERQIGNNGTELLTAQIRLSALYIQIGRSSAARELLGPMVGQLEKRGSNSLEEALQILAIAEDQAGRHREAAECRAKAERIAAANLVP